MNDHLSTIMKVLAVIMSTIALSSTAGPCSSTYKFVDKAEAAQVHSELKKDIHSIENKLGIIDSKQEAMHEDLKAILNHMLRSKKHGH